MTKTHYLFLMLCDFAVAMNMNMNLFKELLKRYQVLNQIIGNYLLRNIYLE